MHSDKVGVPNAQGFIDALLASGRYTFTRAEAQAALGGNPVAVYMALRYLQRKGRIASPRPRAGFYIILEPAYRDAGSSPPEWYVDDMMRHAGVPYYVGLFSAARLHGASHQAVMELQVVAGEQLRPIQVGRVRFRFFYKKAMGAAAVEKRKTHTGYMLVATPETTALDLVRYRESVGSIDAVATVLAELRPHLDARRLALAAAALDEPPVAQRLGLLLERLGAKRLAQAVYADLPRARIRIVALDPSALPEGPVNRRWQVRENVQLDLEAGQAEDDQEAAG